jgi:ABC-type polysaccharide/polyol phosphate transport system ATPase subunit
MTTDVVIRVEGLSKKYLLGQKSGGAGGLRHAIEDSITAPVRWAKALVSGNRSPRPALENPEFWALREVSFEVRRGDVVGIIGRNGAGKSTLLKVLSRITEPTTGRIGLKGRVASLLEVGTGFHPELSGRENVYLNGAVLGMRQAEVRKKFDEIVAFAGVEEFLDTPVKRYSSGMYVRLAFAVAAHLEPEILIVDEVLAVGDAAFQKKCLDKMREVTDGGRTVLFVSHAMHSVRSLCQTGILLNHGRVETMGPVGDVIAAYTNHRPAAGGGDLAGNRALGLALKQVHLSQNDEEGTLHVSALFHLARPIPAAGLGIHIETMEGVELCDLRPETTGFHFGERVGDLPLEFEIPGLSHRLGAGSYRLGLSLHETNWRRCLDRTFVGEFIVPSLDVYATGYPPKLEKDGPLVLPLRLIHA